MAPGMFNTACQLGISIGLAVIGTVSRATTLKPDITNKASLLRYLLGTKQGFGRPLHGLWRRVPWGVLV